MPGKPRKDKMIPHEIETHHVWSRCVGRAYLFGVDPLTGDDFTHRREWLDSATKFFGRVFAVDLGTHHTMANHMHCVIRNRPDIVKTWTDEEVAWRWKMAWPKYEDGEWTRKPTDQEIEEVLQKGREQPGHLPQLRTNLGNISWYMARLKQSIALLANRETDKCGHFWEQRFGNRKLEDEADVIGAFAYTDLQQVKAGIVDSIEASDYSAIQRQIRARASQAFEDIHGHDPRDGSEEDGESMERFEAMFGIDYLSPITSRGPLMTTPEQEVPATELVLPPDADDIEPSTSSSEVDQEQSGEETAADAGPTEAQQQESQAQQSGACQAAASRRRGRPRRPRSYNIHRRQRRRQRRRASRNSILGIGWSEYYDLLKRMEQRLLAEREAAPEPPPPLPPGAVPDSVSPTNWLRSVRQFGAWLQSLAADLPQHLAERLTPPARGEPPVA